MTRKNLKLIMELIFIFILPLIFICFTSEIQVERNFEYDNNGNYETSQETKNLSFDNSIIKYTKVIKYKPTISSYEEIYNQSAKTYIYQELTFNNNEGTYYFSDLPIQIKTKGQREYNGNYLSFYNCTITINYDNENNEFTFNSNNTYLTETITPNIEIINENEFRISDLSYTIQIIGQIVPPPEQVYNKEITINKELHKTVNTIWGNIKQLLVENLELNDNVLLDIVLCYTILWVIMFILWHIFYGFFELIIHVIPNPWERRL